MSGFIVLQREALDHPLLKDGERFRAWFWMVAKACWKPTPFDVGGKIITLERGQFCASRSQLAAAWGWSESAVERFLSRLKTEQMIGRATGQGRSIITICNYSKYQDAEDETGQALEQETGQRSDSDRTAKEQGNKLTRERTPPKGSSPRKSRSHKTNERSEGLNPRATGKNPRAAPSPDVTIPDWVPPVSWEEFLEMRDEKGKHPTDRAIALLVGKLERLRSSGHDPGAVLDQSTLNSWTDIYEIKDRNNGNSSKTNQRSDSQGSDRRSSLGRAIDDGIEHIDAQIAALRSGA